MFLVTLASNKVNNNGRGGFKMDAVVAQRRVVGAEVAEMARAEAVPGYLLNWA